MSTATTTKPGHPFISLGLGLFGLIAWIIPIFGFPVTITGTILGTKATKGPNAAAAIIGAALSIVGLILTTANAAVGAYLGATGRL